ncbi:hypothetical protein AG1IA_08829 [Rhizoctonia solani AG-1 IA]|uniref:Uncharacterized protein n=1 Tax=Thanatephorus cucumeris (strain AG1-IA) TaxID=983506 RepID=L8WK69_THACA|nr:hypothetical protein AG1IA_08829 [Rhizoctonia solani AG-1 IA]
MPVHWDKLLMYREAIVCELKRGGRKDFQTSLGLCLPSTRVVQPICIDISANKYELGGQTRSNRALAIQFRRSIRSLSPREFLIPNGF